jgi:hypothetical protein
MTGIRNFFISKMSRLSSYAMGTGLQGPGCQVDHSHVVPTLRMSGAITLLSLYAFVVWRGSTVFFIYTLSFFLSFFLLLNVLDNMQKKCCSRDFLFLQIKTVVCVYSSLCVFLHSFAGRISVTLGRDTVFLNRFPL